MINDMVIGKPLIRMGNYVWWVVLIMVNKLGIGKIIITMAICVKRSFTYESTER
jgi:hypothetical protein